jgi:site-specific DNA-methyltransferase (adenine-specific)
MGKRWDYDVPSVDVWTECLRVLKPGGHLLAFAGTRTQHRMAVRIEDAGFEIRDMIAWVYGSGFPKSLDVSKAIDKAAGAEGGRGPMKLGGERLARLENGKRDGEGRWGDESGRNPYTYAPATPEAKQWQGWGTALKPALEPITVARKPLIGTVAENVLQHGTGAINVDGGRVGTEQRYNPPAGNKAGGNSLNMSAVGMPEDADGRTAAGRWPANFIHDGSEEATDLLGASARFFYCAKASKADRGENHHPTVKPTDLMRYLCRLVTPPNGIVLDPFMGSGSTGKAAMLEGFAFVGIEREAEYIDIAKARIQSAVGLL